jgi:PAS domain S-box-containing protein
VSTDFVLGDEFARVLAETAQELVCVLDSEGRILLFNDACERATGYRRKELLGRDAREFWPDDPEHRSRWEALGAEAAVAGVATGFGLRYRGAGTAMRSVDLTIRRVEHDGRAYEIVMFRDAGPREALDAAQREVLDLRAITLVANAAAHEINNPLTVIVGSVELLQRRLGPEAAETKWVDRAIDSAQRIREIIARMTKITRVEASGSYPGVPAMLDIRRSSDDN